MGRNPKAYGEASDLNEQTAALRDLFDQFSPKPVENTTKNVIIKMKQGKNKLMLTRKMKRTVNK